MRCSRDGNRPARRPRSLARRRAAQGGRVAVSGPISVLRVVSGWGYGLGWHRLGYGEMTEELRLPCDHLEKLHFCAHQY